MLDKLSQKCYTSGWSRVIILLLHDRRVESSNSNDCVFRMNIAKTSEQYDPAQKKSVGRKLKVYLCVGEEKNETN